jgi:hypothetical protein
MGSKPIRAEEMPDDAVGNPDYTPARLAAHFRREARRGSVEILDRQTRSWHC